jgi:hypothetical protein
MNGRPLEYTIEFGGAHRDVTITTSGQPTGEDVLAFVLALVGHPRFRRGMAILVDHLALDVTTITGEDIKAQAELVNALDDQLGPCHVAIVVPDVLAFGFGRLWELHTAETQLHSRVFYDRDEALAWLEAQEAEHAARSA